jgi:hypothetical protein
MSDGSIQWKYIREILYWENRGDPNRYPYSEICPDLNMFMANSMYSLSKKKKLFALDNEMWNAKLAQSVVNCSSWYRVRNGAIELFPKYGDDEKIIFCYRTNHIVFDGDDNHKKQFFTKNNDTCELPSDLLIWGTVYKWRLTNGFDSTLSLEQYNKYKDRFITESKVNERIKISGSSYLYFSHLPEGDWDL